MPCCRRSRRQREPGGGLGRIDNQGREMAEARKCPVTRERSRVNPPFRSFRAKSRNKPRRPSRLFLDYARNERGAGDPRHQAKSTHAIRQSRAYRKAGRPGQRFRHARHERRGGCGVASLPDPTPPPSVRFERSRETSPADDHACFSTTLETNGGGEHRTSGKPTHIPSVRTVLVGGRAGRTGSFDRLGTNGFLSVIMLWRSPSPPTPAVPGVSKLRSRAPLARRLGDESRGVWTTRNHALSCDE